MQAVATATLPVPTCHAVAVAPSEYESTVTVLAKKPSPTLLYQSGSHLGYILGCYFAGGGLIAMGVFNSMSATTVPKSDYAKGKIMPIWLPYFVHVGSLFMVGAGAWICLRVRCAYVCKFCFPLIMFKAPEPRPNHQIHAFYWPRPPELGVAARAEPFHAINHTQSGSGASKGSNHVAHHVDGRA